MSKQTDFDRADEAARNAPRIGNDLRSTDREGGHFPPSSAGTPAGRDGGPGVPVSGGTAERLPGWNDRPAKMPPLPPNDPSKR